MGTVRITGSRAALADGLGRVARAPVVLVCVYIVTVAAALPLAAAMQHALRAYFGSSLAAAQAARGAHSQWWSEFTARSGDLGATLQPTIVGFAAVLDNLSALFDNVARPTPVLWAGAGYLLLWLFLNGGVLDRYARARPTRSYGFFTACGVQFARFLRLAPIIAGTYLVLFAYVHPLLFDTIAGSVSRDITSERTAFFLRFSLYLVFGMMLMTAHVLFTYAQVRAVVEDRRSMLGALVAAARFIGRNAAGVAGLHVMVLALSAAIMFVYALTAIDAPASAFQMWMGVAIGQGYIAARLATRLVLMASAVALFQGRLAHAGFIASGPVEPPVPPMVEQLSTNARTPTPVT